VVAWLSASVGIAILSFLTGLFGPLGGFGPPGRYVAALFPLSMLCSLLWLLIIVAAIIALRWRALWLLIAAPGALFWPMLFILLAYNIKVPRPPL
jgi:hypothetical protein